MTPTATPTRTEQLRSLAATLRRVRIICAGLGALAFLVWRPPEGMITPHPVAPWGVAVVAWLLLTNMLAVRMSASEDVPVLEGAATVEVALDSALVMFVIALLSFDQVGAEWGLLNIVVLEAAMRLRLRGAIACWAVNTAMYLAIQVWAEDRYGVDNRWSVAVFRMSMVLIVAFVGGSLTRQLEAHTLMSRRAREEADERARLLRIAAEASRSMSALGGDDVLDAITSAAVQLGFDAADVCVLDQDAGRWVIQRSINLPDAYRESGQSAENGLSAIVRREARTVVIDDYLGWDGGLPEIQAAGFRTVAGVPVRVGGEIVATLGVGTCRPRPITSAELECLELLAGQAAAALDATHRQSYATDLYEKLTHSTTHDRLTGLPNRATLLDHLGTALAAGRDHEVAVVVCDLDGFKTLNDSLGHHAGDQLLRAVASRLSATALDRVVARLAGDEFGIVVERGGVEAAARLARMLLVDLREPMEIDGNSLSVSLSVGIAAQGQTPGEDATSLLRDAGLALERAKSSGRGRYEVFDPSLRARAQLRLATETDLRNAINDGSLSVQYQPMLSLVTGAIVGVEALARWVHPERGPVPPAEFIPLAEESGLIFDLGTRILEIACRQMREWQRVVGSSIRLAVNVSAVQLQSPRCADSVAAILQATGVAPSQLTMELTETAVMDDTPEVLRSVQALGNLGVRLSVDDLGRGWSSLAYLSRYPLSELKIDRTFVQGVARRHADRAVVRALVTLAHDLELTVVAEGIEDADQLAELSRLGCDVGQGFHLHRPQSAADITELVVGGASLRVG